MREAEEMFVCVGDSKIVIASFIYIHVITMLNFDLIIVTGELVYSHEYTSHIHTCRNKTEWRSCKAGWTDTNFIYRNWK